MSGPTKPGDSGIRSQEGVVSRPEGTDSEPKPITETISSRMHHGHSEKSQFEPFTSLADQKKAGEREYGYDQGHPVPENRNNEDYSFMERKPGKKSYFSELLEKYGKHLRISVSFLLTILFRTVSARLAPCLCTNKPHTRREKWGNKIIHIMLMSMTEFAGKLSVYN
ncbi:hypothetical protein TRV_01440 [Trichophyton verrucosum HKI 0517]|uniref:Uncharacterized protein n=1 Tax=Trichophyton verrucosum (strain HKI 0517) TaxID=663202 RepID=D4D2Y4_TRIVH|nr:uncharacterized protein TRV_01440 [Trichophyton verrucosum HKI 0517]EFE43763.1 hypothetical protein TRV_01440 [Trichophyton verrucosum HKI 0517]